MAMVWPRLWKHSGTKWMAFRWNDIEEFRSLRAWTNKRALVLGYIGQDDIPEALQLDAELGVSDPDLIRFIAQAGGILGIRPKLHLEIDALLGRFGSVPRPARGHRFA